MKYYQNGQELNAKILKGIDILADNVASTLGPKGRNVILYHKEENIPVITKDGVTVAKEIELKDKFEMLSFCSAKTLNQWKTKGVNRQPLFNANLDGQNRP